VSSRPPDPRRGEYCGIPTSVASSACRVSREDREPARRRNPGAVDSHVARVIDYALAARPLCGGRRHVNRRPSSTSAPGIRVPDEHNFATLYDCRPWTSTEVKPKFSEASATGGTVLLVGHRGRTSSSRHPDTDLAGPSAGFKVRRRQPRRHRLSGPTRCHATTRHHARHQLCRSSTA